MGQIQLGLNVEDLLHGVRVTRGSINNFIHLDIRIADRNTIKYLLTEGQSQSMRHFSEVLLVVA